MVYDLLVVGILVAGLVVGWWKGFALQLGGLLAVLVGFLVGLLATKGALAAMDRPAPVRGGLVFVAGYFLASTTLYAVMGAFRKKLEKRETAARADNALGAALGLLHAALKVLLLTLAVVVIAPSTRGPIKERPTGAVVARALRGVATVLPEEVVDEIRELIER